MGTGLRQLLIAPPFRRGTYYGNDNNTVAIAKYTQGLIGSGRAIKAAKQGNSQASSAIDTKLLLFTNSLIAVMANMVMLEQTIYGIESMRKKEASPTETAIELVSTVSEEAYTGPYNYNRINDESKDLLNEEQPPPALVPQDTAHGQKANSSESDTDVD
ncbi:hypothetical protein Daesc_001479 [Daldinia eschscholtzii]|uniref:Uncharacterized protein n=1 Tax=Daldinia eschscholtzii TaxID=292717 RepID=A0AAX6MUL3_9PEZI